MVGKSCAHAEHERRANAMTPTTKVPELLRRSGLRPTRQRLLLGELLFGRGHRHATAEMLHGEAVEAGERVSLASFSRRSQ